MLQPLLNALHWFGGGPLVVALIVAGMYLTFRTGLMAVRRFFSIIRLTLGTLFKRNGRQVRAGDISPFQALTTALAATVGTGNIAGVATAIALGGPGAIFWMWVSALFGMTTKYSEIVLAVYYRCRARDGTVAGGPMYFLEHGLNRRSLSLLFALFGAIAAFGIGNLVQANTVASAVDAAFGVPPLISGLVMALLAAPVILGGIRRIGFISEKIVPIMALFYIGGALFILYLHREVLLSAFREIIGGAFTGRAAAGGFAGAGVLQAARYGIARGVFSNEAGLGSAAIAHAAARTDHPVRQGLWGVIEVVIDTHLICTLTALVLLVTGAWTGGQEGASMTAEAFNAGLPGLGSLIVTVALIFFAFSTLISWSYYGEKSFEYLTGGGNLYYRLAWIGLIVVGATGGLQSVWAISDTLNALMAIPNLAGLVGLSGMVVSLNRKFWDKKP
jgi:AGCS family alanine or glycine:cation symporter